MSGIVALLRHDGAPIDRELLAQMTVAQRFRGPDAEGTWFDGAVGFGHTLHKAALEAEHEQQPAALGGRLFITADARVDARDDLCAELRGRGIDARTDATDCDLILKAYEAWGEGCVEHLLGDFSFALWDAPRCKLLCAVDHLGVKPFYYANRDGLFAGSNSLRCVQLHSGVRRVLNEIAVGDFLMFGCYEDRSSTIFEDIARIPPGHYLVVEHGALRVQRYFTLPQPKEVRWPDEDACVEAFEEVLGKAVRDRLRTPRMAVYMSGGVDSPLIALTAKRELERSFANSALEAFSMVYDRLIPDEERHYAGLAAASLGIPIDFEAADDAQLYDWSESISPPQPTDALTLGPTMAQLARLTARFSTVLTGYDGDALLKAALRLHWPQRVRERSLLGLARELAWYVQHERGLPPIGVRTAVARIGERAMLPRRPAWLRDDFCARTHMDERWNASLRPARLASARAPSLVNFRDSAWGRLFDSYDPEAVGIALEVRHPFCDLRVIRFTFGLPAVPWCVDKHLLRRCLRAMPRALVTRPKTPLQGEPDLELFRAAGLGAGPGEWNTSALEHYVDAEAVRRALGPEARPDLYELLRAVGFGIWLRNSGPEAGSRSPSAVAHASRHARFTVL